MALVRVVPDAARREREALHQLGAQVLGLHDRVDDELGREVHEVDVFGVLPAAVGDERGPLVGSSIAWMRL